MEENGSDDELFGLDETCVRDESKADNSWPSGLSYDEVLLRQLKSSLAGVPPPPQVTYPQQKIEDIVNLLKDTESWMNFESHRSGYFHQKINCDQDGGKNCSWPEVKFCIFFDISYNLGELSERIVELCDKYRERYVGCETSSFVTANSPTKDYGVKKNRRKALGRSPRRFSYQTHRRRVFSSSSLQEACKANAFGITKKTILLPKTTSLHLKLSAKDDVKETKRALFLTADERKNLRLESLKRSPSKVKSMEMRRSLWLQRKLPKKGATPRKQTPKKQLSGNQTPKKSVTPKKIITPSKRTPRKYGTPKKQTPRKPHTPKKLGIAKCSNAYRITNENGKRSRSDLDSGDDTLLSGRLNVDSLSSDDSRQETNVSVLSDSQRRKLLWAVSTALKQVGVGSSHKHFRTFYRKLFKICKLMWTSCPSNATIKQGISERMLALANDHVNAVVNESHVNTDSLDMWSQDSNSCDFFFASGGEQQG